MSNASFFDNARSRFRAGFAEVHRKWGWYLALGVFLIILGFLASGMAVTTTLLSVVVLGGILLGAGAGMVVLSFLTGKWSGFLLTLAAGIFSVIFGTGILSNPVSGAVAITMMIGILLVGAGIFRSIASIVMQFPNWGWSLVSGIVTFALGFLLMKNVQSTSLWFLGLAVGIDLILHGFAWIMFSLRLHSLAGELGITEAGRPAA
jgi:uncharacterized membrane protein HdeD (DUF308 family)